jgi:hypothetical protein
MLQFPFLAATYQTKNQYIKMLISSQKKAIVSLIKSAISFLSKIFYNKPQLQPIFLTLKRRR